MPAHPLAHENSLRLACEVVAAQQFVRAVRVWLTREELSDGNQETLSSFWNRFMGFTISGIPQAGRKDSASRGMRKAGAVLGRTELAAPCVFRSGGVWC